MVNIGGSEEGKWVAGDWGNNGSLVGIPIGLGIVLDEY